jgi:hypothetical protein
MVAAARFPHADAAPPTPHLTAARARAAHDGALTRGDAAAAAAAVGLYSTLFALYM